MHVDKAINISDLRYLAKRRLPKIIFDYIEGGCEDETALQRNVEGFARHQFVPRYLVDTAPNDQSATVFGQTYRSPFGIAPTGLAGLYRPGGALTLAEAAKLADIPFIQSGASTSSIEDIAKVAPNHAWFQLYHPRDKKIADDLVNRAHDAGIRTLVLTIDAQGGSNQERNIRNGFTQPLTMSISTILEALLHPYWVAGYLRHGMPVFADWQRYCETAPDARSVAKFVAAQGRAVLTWKDVDRLRRLWSGNLVVKGILRPDDALRAVECGADGIIVSNHGGRKLDRVPASIDAFPAIRSAVGAKVTLMLDSGLQRGADAVVALCLGAQFCFVGRAALYGLVAGGLAGSTRAIDILRNEIDLIMRQIGCGDIASLGPEMLFDWRKTPE